MQRNYERLSVEDFGARLLEIGDLDPIYIALNHMELPHEQLCRWLVAYWCLYHAGVACYLSDQRDDVFWEHLMIAAQNELEAPPGGRWPRGAERRHWRGKQAVDSASELYQYKNAHHLVQMMTGNSLDIDYASLRENVLRLRGFGDWIAFKIGDMIDVLGIASVNFQHSEVFMFSEPRKSALMVARQRLGLAENATFKDENAVIKGVVEHLTAHFHDTTAPPRHERSIDLQEVETILCKWKSHMNGHYPVGKDIVEISQGLQPWIKYSETAMMMSQAMPYGLGDPFA